MNKRLVFGVLLISMLILTACGRPGDIDRPRDREYERFYQGTEGVRMYIDSVAPPPRLYYYGDAPTDQYNAFNIDVELQNEGASWTKGGLYVSGYDPTLIYIEGINIPKTGGGIFDNCRLDLDRFDLGNALGGYLGCNFGEFGFELGADSRTDNFFDSVRINNLFQLFGWEDGPEIDVNWDGRAEAFNLNFDLSMFGFDLDALHHGRALLLILDGLSFDRFNGQTFLLAPDDYNYPGGESTLISFPAYVQHNWPKGLDEIDVTFLVTSCYAYSTYATPIVCIDPAPYSENEKVCYPGQTRLTSSQGAPVAVTNIVQENTPRSVIFSIEIRNVGNGKIFYPGDLELCSPYYPGRLGPQSLDTVVLGDIRLSGSPQRLRCSPDDNIIRLRDGRGYITCTYDLEYATAKSAYNAPLVLEFWYGYSETQRRNVRIKRVS